MSTCCICDEEIREGEETREFPLLVNPLAHKDCADTEARCPMCAEALSFDIVVSKIESAHPDLDPEDWNDKYDYDTVANKKEDLLGIFSDTDEDPSSFRGSETWSCSNCHHVFWENEVD